MSSEKTILDHEREELSKFSEPSSFYTQVGQLLLDTMRILEENPPKNGKDLWYERQSQSKQLQDALVRSKISLEQGEIYEDTILKQTCTSIKETAKTKFRSPHNDFVNRLKYILKSHPNQFHLAASFVYKLYDQNLNLWKQRNKALEIEMDSMTKHGFAFILSELKAHTNSKLTQELSDQNVQGLLTELSLRHQRQSEEIKKFELDYQSEVSKMKEAFHERQSEEIKKFELDYQSEVNKLKDAFHVKIKEMENSFNEKLQKVEEETQKKYKDISELSEMAYNAANELQYTKQIIEFLAASCPEKVESAKKRIPHKELKKIFSEEEESKENKKEKKAVKSVTFVDPEESASSSELKYSGETYYNVPLTP